MEIVNVNVNLVLLGIYVKHHLVLALEVLTLKSVRMEEPHQEIQSQRIASVHVLLGLKEQIVKLRLLVHLEQMVSLA